MGGKRREDELGRKEWMGRERGGGGVLKKGNVIKYLNTWAGNELNEHSNTICSVLKSVKI